MKIKTLALALVASTAMTGAAHAASFTKTYVVAATYAVNQDGESPLFKSVSQTFTIQFDPEKSVKPIITDYSSNSAGIFSSAPKFIDFVHRSNQIEFSIAYGLSASDFYSTEFSTDLFGDNVSTPTGIYAVRGRIFGSSDLTINVTTPAIPEPATWAMMLVGFGLVGGAVRYRRRNTAIRYA